MRETGNESFRCRGDVQRRLDVLFRADGDDCLSVSDEELMMVRL